MWTVRRKKNNNNSSHSNNKTIIDNKFTRTVHYVNSYVCLYVYTRLCDVYIVASYITTDFNALFIFVCFRTSQLVNSQIADTRVSSTTVNDHSALNTSTITIIYHRTNRVHDQLRSRIWDFIVNHTGRINLATKSNPKTNRPVFLPFNHRIGNCRFLICYRIK